MHVFKCSGNCKLKFKKITIFGQAECMKCTKYLFILFKIRYLTWQTIILVQSLFKIDGSKIIII